MSNLQILPDKVVMPLTTPRSKIRISDTNGNHVAKPTEGLYSCEQFIEWMITNNEISELVDSYLIKDDINEIIRKLDSINNFLVNSGYRVRRAVKTKKDSKFENFDVYEYDEKFFSFEREIDENIFVRVTFKMGDFTLAAHMFILFPFSNREIKLFNNAGEITLNTQLGSGAYALWKPTKKQIKEIIVGLSHSSQGHRNDLLEILRNKLV